jgi:hypothetical protein
MDQNIINNPATSSGVVYLKIIYKCCEISIAYPRFIRSVVEQALADTPCVLLTGPRQSGKTTLVDAWSTPSASVSFDDWSMLHQAKNDPEGFVNQLVAQNPEQLVVMDEIQHVPELFLPIKRTIDQKRRAGMFLITGSANLLSWSKTPDSLAGRIEHLNLYPLSILEIKGRNESWIDPFFEGDQYDFQINTQSFKTSQEDINKFIGATRKSSDGVNSSSSLFIIGDDFTPITKFDTHNHFWQLIFTVKAPPCFLGCLDQFEYHDKRCFSG